MKKNFFLAAIHLTIWKENMCNIILTLLGSKEQNTNKVLLRYKRSN